MFVLIQLPFADARPFVAGARRLRTPPWPLAEPNREFVRAVGQVRERMRGGASPWAGEDVYCDARRILRIEPTAAAGRRGLCRFRRYLSDGCVRARIEIGIVLPASSAPVTASVAHALSLQFSVPHSSGTISGGPLELQRALARALLRSTTSFQAADHFWGESWWLEPGRPLVIVECGDGDPAPPAGSRAVPVAEEYGISLHTFTVSRSEIAARVWLLRSQPDADRDVLRRLRMHLLCIHAERMALRQILRLIATGRLELVRGPDEFDELQRYLLGTFHSLRRERRYGICGDLILDVADQADDLVSLDVRSTLLARLTDARLNLRRVVERQLEREVAASSAAAPAVIHQKVVFGDTYEVTGQAGAVGANAQARQVAMTQIWNELSAGVDLKVLGVELERLHRDLARRELTRTEHDALLEVAQAAGAARRGDGPGALAHLSRTGRWVLKVARDIGVDLAAGVIKELLTA